MMNQQSSATMLGNRYQLLQTIGTGGMAVVYRARDTMLERPVAIKVLREDFSQGQDFRDRFRQEALAAANLSHPNIVTVHDFGLDGDKLFIVMEYIPGTDLKSIIKQRGKMQSEEAIPLMIQACAGIGYAHRAGLVHCDVKPQNMLVTPDQRLKVTDFGIARALATIHPDEQSDIVWGSPQYFSPEQAAGLAPSPASDVYSLGVILYEMLTGRLPFISSDPSELARQHRDSKPIPPRKLAPEIPPALEQILLKVLQKEPAARYRTADQLGRVLLTFTSQANSFSSNIPPMGPINLQAAKKPFQPAPVQANPITPPVIHQYTPADPIENTEPITTADDDLAFDWGTIGLSLLATLMVGGLIPFWIYVGFSIIPH